MKANEMKENKIKERKDLWTVYVATYKQGDGI